MAGQGTSFPKTSGKRFLTELGPVCYDWLSLRVLFSSLLHLPSYVSIRTMSIPGGLVCILPWSPDLLSCTLSSGRPYPCSSFTLLLLNGVGSRFWSRCNSHCLFVIPADSIISPRRFSRIASCSLWLIVVLRRSITFHDDASRSTYTTLPLYYFLHTYSTQFKVSCRVQVLPWETHKSPWFT